MPKKKYTPEFKKKIIIAILQGDKELNAICAENTLKKIYLSVISRKV